MSIRNKIIDLMLNRYYEDFAATAARAVLQMDGVEELYSLSTDNELNLPLIKKERVIFRAAYTLEYIYFNHSEHFAPFTQRLFDDMPKCQNSSAKRIFGKIMAHMLKEQRPSPDQMNAIAEAAAQWVSDPKTKVAVKVWAMAILKSLRSQLSWVDLMWDDLETIASQDATPAINVRFRRGW